MIGATIGNFKIVQRLGRGGMGEVYLAEQTNIGTRVAIKVLRPEVSSDTEHVQRFFNEARAVSKIQHAGIVKIFDVGYASGGEAYLIMEYLEGETLAKRIEQRGRLALPELGDIGKQIASVLGATHGAGITHRDLKPDNIYLIPDRELARGERVKILDFGIAKLTGTLAGASPQTIGTMGTPAYMAPEQWGDASKVDWRADVYSLGCVAYEMATGRPPFIVTNIAEACAMHLHKIPVRARTLVPDLPVALDELLARLLEKQPDARPQSMQELARAFDAIAEGRASAVVAAAGAATRTTIPPAIAATMPPGGEMISPPPRKSRAPLFAIGGVAIAAAGAAAAYLAVSHEEHTATQERAPEDARRVVQLAADAAPAPAHTVPAVVSTPPVDAAVVTPPKPRPPPTGITHATIDRKLVEETIEQQKGPLIGCYQRKLPPSGKLEVKLTIEIDGYATQVATGLEPRVDACIVDILEKLKFPRPQGGAVPLELAIQLAEPVPADETPPDPEDRAGISAAMQTVHPQIVQCAEKLDVHGKSTIHIDIAPDGSVRRASLAGRKTGSPFEACIADVVKRVRFPKQAHPTAVNWPVSLR